MRFSQAILIAAVATMAMVVSAGSAMAHINGSTLNMIAPDSHNYTGAWPVTVTGSQFHNGTACLTLTQNGGNGGGASLVMDGQRYPYGSFLVINHILMATIVKPSGSQNGALTFSASANRGHIGHGLFENIEGGSNFDFGALTFGTKNGC